MMQSNEYKGYQITRCRNIAGVEYLEIRQNGQYISYAADMGEVSALIDAYVSWGDKIAERT
jgi:hypothetical protein